tara:strand:- start:45318 stop:45548 length:231 start_codon:yes stop_codon:yes gene_type:complete
MGRTKSLTIDARSIGHAQVFDEGTLASAHHSEVSARNSSVVKTQLATERATNEALALWQFNFVVGICERQPRHRIS